MRSQTSPLCSVSGIKKRLQMTASSSSRELMLEIPVLLRKLEPQLIGRYDFFLLDQFGVLHDGTNPLPGAIEMVNMLRESGKKVVVTSNSSQRVNVAKRRWLELGFPPVSDFITSGEFAWHYLNMNYRGKKAIIFGWRSQLGVEEYLKGTDIEILSPQRVDEADVLIFQGSETMGYQDISLKYTGQLDDEVVDVMTRAAEKGLLGVCANQDKKACWAREEYYMPGMLEEAYRVRFGGETVFYGKPDYEFFTAAVSDRKIGQDLKISASKSTKSGNCEEFLRDLSDKELEAKFGHYDDLRDDLDAQQRRRKWASEMVKAVHVGDSLQHDVEGAINAGLDVIFVTKHGVHRNDIYTLRDEQAENAGGTAADVEETEPHLLLTGVCQLCDSLNVARPTFILEAFCQ